MIFTYYVYISHLIKAYIKLEQQHLQLHIYIYINQHLTKNDTSTITNIYIIFMKSI